MTQEKLYALLILIIGVSLLTFGALRSQAEDKPAAAKAAHSTPVTAPAPTTPILPDAQKIALLQAETAVLSAQVDTLQSQLVTADKKATFTASRDAFLRQFEDSFKAAGVTSEDFDLDLPTLTFKARSKAAPVTK